MMWKQFIRSAVACMALGLFVAGCSDAGTARGITAPTESEADFLTYRLGVVIPIR